MPVKTFVSSKESNLTGHGARMKTDQLFNRTTPLAATEGQRSLEMPLNDTTGSVRITCMPITTTAVYNVVAELETDSGPWEPETISDVTHGTVAGTDNKVACSRFVHVMPAGIVAGFTVPTFGFQKIRVSVWGAAGDLVQINGTRLNRSPT